MLSKQNMLSNVTITSCSINELGIIQALFKNVGFPSKNTTSAKSLERHVQLSGDLFLIALYESKILGTVIGDCGIWQGNICCLAVIPEYRRLGIGTALVRELERRLYNKQVGYISVHIKPKDDTLISFWNSLGRAGYKPEGKIFRYCKVF